MCYLDSDETASAVLAEPLLDAAFADDEAGRALLHEAMDRPYRAGWGTHEDGLACVSTDERNLGLQRQALDAAGCERIRACEEIATAGLFASTQTRRSSPTSSR
jgi:hypothetical protein